MAEYGGIVEGRKSCVIHFSVMFFLSDEFKGLGRSGSWFL